MLLWLFLFFFLAIAFPVLADGEPTAQLSDSGIIVPVDEHRTNVLDQRVTITLLAPKQASEQPAIVRAEYLLVNDSRTPVSIVGGLSRFRREFVCRPGFPVEKGGAAQSVPDWWGKLQC